MPVVAVSETTGALLALVVVVLLAWIGGGHDRRSPWWTPALVMATYPHAEAVCRLLQRRRVACRLMPAVERLDVDRTGGVVVLVPATQIDHAANVLNRQPQGRGPVPRPRASTPIDDEEQP